FIARWCRDLAIHSLHHSRLFLFPLLCVDLCDFRWIWPTYRRSLAIARGMSRRMVGEGRYCLGLLPAHFAAKKPPFHSEIIRPGPGRGIRLPGSSSFASKPHGKISGLGVGTS